MVDERAIPDGDGMTTYDDLVLADGPVLYLPLDDASGTTAVALAGSAP